MAFTTAAQTPVLTQHDDIARTGQNTAETILTPSNVNTTQFGKLFSLKVDGQVYAQPLYVPKLTINGAVHNVLIVATEADSFYAFDADSNTGTNATYLWHASMIDTAHGAASGATPVPYTTVGCTDMQPQSGITSTPVIDTSTGNNLSRSEVSGERQCRSSPACSRYHHGIGEIFRPGAYQRAAERRPRNRRWQFIQRVAV